MIKQRKELEPSLDRGARGIHCSMSKGSFIKVARIGVLLSCPLGFPCHVKALCLAKNKGIDHGYWEFEKLIGNIKKNMEREN